MSGTRYLTYLADAIGDELSLPNKWVVFCSLWASA